MKIRTNNVPRPIVSGCELEGNHRKQALATHDYLGDDFDESTFVVYRGYVHYLGNFERLEIVNGKRGPGPLVGWSGFEPDGMTNGTLIRLSDDGETAVLGYVIGGQS